MSGAGGRSTIATGGAAATDPLKLYKSVDGYRAIMEWYESLVEKIGVPFDSLYVNSRFGRTVNPHFFTNFYSAVYIT